MAAKCFALATGEIATDVGSVVYGREAVQVGLVDQLGSVGDALAYLHREIEARRNGGEAGIENRG